MGQGTWTNCAYNELKLAKGFTAMSSLRDFSTQKIFTMDKIHKNLNPYNVVRECCETEEHPNTIPIVLGLDVTGNMNRACKSCLDSLNETIINLYKDYKDVEIAIAGIGDFAYDKYPFQLSQFESDARIADNLFNLYIENGGGGNSWESYTALWYGGLYHTKLDCWKRGKKGILISLGDENLNYSLPKNAILRVFGDVVQNDIDTRELYEQVLEKFDVYHIAITNDSSYWRYKDGIKETWGELLGQNLIISTSDNLPNVISSIVKDSMSAPTASVTFVNENGEISW